MLKLLSVMLCLCSLLGVCLAADPNEISKDSNVASRPATRPASRPTSRPTGDPNEWILASPWKIWRGGLLWQGTAPMNLLELVHPTRSWPATHYRISLKANGSFSGVGVRLNGGEVVAWSWKKPKIWHSFEIDIDNGAVKVAVDGQILKQGALKIRTFSLLASGGSGEKEDYVLFSEIKISVLKE